MNINATANKTSAMTKTMPKFKDALAAFEAGVLANPWTPSSTNARKVLGSLSKVPALYRQIAPELPTDEILCDVDMLERLVAPYLKSRTVPENCRLKNFTSFKTCISNVRRFFNLANGLRALKKPPQPHQDGWSVLLQEIAAADNGKPILSAKKLIPLVTFIGRCRERNLDAKDLNREALIDFIEKSPTRKANVIRQAVKLLDWLRESGLVSTELLLPDLIGDLSNVLADGQWKCPELHDEYSAAVDKYIQNRSDGKKTAKLGTTSFEIDTRNGVGDSRQTEIRTSLRWFHHGLVVAGLVDYEQPFNWQAVYEPALLKKVVDLDAEGAMHRETEGKTRGKRVRDVIRFLDTRCDGYAASVDSTFFDYVALNNPAHHVTDKKAWKQKTTLEFLDSITLQQAFYGMPQRFFAESMRLIDRWDELADEGSKSNISPAQGRALDLALTGVDFTITTRFPLRQGTCRKLRIAGSNPHIIFPNGANDEVRVYPDATIIKNEHQFPTGIPLYKSKKFNPTEMLRWYIDKVHPLVLEHRVQAPNRSPELLLCGVGRNSLAKKINRHTIEAGLFLDGHMMRHLTGSVLYKRGVALDDIAELLGITVTTLVKNYVYVNRQQKVQRAIDEVADVYKGLGL